MAKTFFVCDSYHTTTIAEALKKAFPDAVIFTDTTKIPLVGGVPDIANQLTHMATESRPGVTDQVEGRVDYFIVSAKLISDGLVDVTEYKTLYGHEQSKFIAVSTMYQFLDSVKSLVDYTSAKDVFVSASSAKKFFVDHNEIL